MNDEWKPIETAPKDGTPVILVCRFNVLGQKCYEFGRYGRGDTWYRQDNTVIVKPATHWMAIPTPPETGGE